MSTYGVPTEDLAQTSSARSLASWPAREHTSPPQPPADPPRKRLRILDYKPHRNPGRNARRAKTGRPFVQLFHCWWSSPVIRSLSSIERDALVSILTRHNGRNNGNLPVSVRWLSRELSIGKSTAQRALDHLRTAGLIERVVAGRFQGRISRAARWRVTCLPCDVSGRPPIEWTMLPPLTRPLPRAIPLADNL
jgi:DNA-binding transcriptional ArsR family regulator